MVYEYKVTLEGIKGFHRIYRVKGDTTLYGFHVQLRSDLEFPLDQLILFKALDADGGVVARYGLFDLGSGTVDTVTVSKTVAEGVASFVYFYDVTNRKSVIITLIGEVDGEIDEPVSLVDSKGPNPVEFENGYVAYEDLPEDQKHRHLPGLSPFGGEDDEDDEDEEDDEEEDEDDDEDGEVIYDASEGL